MQRHLPPPLHPQCDAEAKNAAGRTRIVGSTTIDFITTMASSLGVATPELPQNMVKGELQVDQDATDDILLTRQPISHPTPSLLQPLALSSSRKSSSCSSRNLYHELRLFEMYRIQRATSNTTAHDNLASVTTNISNAGRNLLRNALDFVFRYLQICLGWTARRSCQAIAALWRASRITDLLHSVYLIFLQILKLCGMALAIVIGLQIVVRLGYWGLPKLWGIYRKRRMRRLEERRQNEERKQYAAYISERRAMQAAEAVAKQEARLRQAREDQAIKEQRRRDEDKRQIRARAVYMRWKQECDIIFQDKASMTKFPFPPLSRCTDLECPVFLKMPVPACQHNLERFLRGSGNFSLEFLKRQRHLWHEDRFACCRADLRPEFRRLANSLFVVLDPWYEALRRRETNSSSLG